MTGVYGDDETYLNYFAHKDPLAFYGFSSLDAMIEEMENFNKSGIRSGDDRAVGWSNGPSSFYGTKTFDEALQLAKFGWSEGAELADEISQTMTAERAKAPKLINTMIGGSVNVPRMLSGNPVHMRKKAKRDKVKVVTVFVSCAMLSSVSQEISNFKASVICGIIDLLERNGYSCELVVTGNSNTMRDKPGFQFATILKNSGENLNVEDTVFALGHSAFFRRFVFTLTGMAKECEPLWSYMGRTVQSFNKSNPTKKNEIYIDRLTPELSNQLTRIKDQSERINHLIKEICPIPINLTL